MNRIALVVLTGAIALSASGAADVFQQLGMKKSDVPGEAIFSLATGQVAVSQVRSSFKAASPAARAAIVEQVLTWTRAYIASPQFAKDWAAYREEQKPAAPDAQPSVDAVLKQRQAERRAEMAEARKNLADMPASMRKDAEAAVRDAEKQLLALEKDPEFVKAERQAIAAEQAETKRQYDEELRSWNEQYPANPRQLVKQRLREFLDASANVDFDAKLVSRHGKMRFANERYEDQSGEWKLCYRAGREATMKARAIAQTWLAELK